jgi:competence protein ComEC
MRRLALFISIFILLVSACTPSDQTTPTTDLMEVARQTLAVLWTPTTPLLSTPSPAGTLPPTAAPLQVETSQPAGTSTSQLPGTVQAPFTPTPSNRLRVYFLDVGEGEATLLLTPEGKTVLIDGGDTDGGIVSYLQIMGVKQIDLMIASLPQSEHMGGLVKVLQAIPVTKVVTNGQKPSTLLYTQFQEAIDAAKVITVEAKRGDTLTTGSLAFNVLNPVSPNGDDPSNNSLVLRLVYGKIAFLFMGDAGWEAEDSLLSAGLPVQADILKVGHHGSRYASGPEFLAQVKPELAIYFAGQRNTHGFPHAEALAALENAGAQVAGTDVNGTITVTTDGNGYQFDLTRQGEPQAPPITPTPTEEKLTLEIINYTNPVAPGGSAALRVLTTPGATCTIKVYYNTGPSEAPGLEPKTANYSGFVLWSWQIGTGVKPGTYRIVVTASFKGETVSRSVMITVTK